MLHMMARSYVSRRHDLPDLGESTKGRALFSQEVQRRAPFQFRERFVHGGGGRRTEVLLALPLGPRPLPFLIGKMRRPPSCFYLCGRKDVPKLFFQRPQKGCVLVSRRPPVQTLGLGLLSRPRGRRIPTPSLTAT